jgi:UDP-N-acetylmuramoylalanine--D-glutamate ligase
METSATQARPGLTLGQFAAFSGGETALSPDQRARPLAAVWNDSRKVAAGDVFVALETETDDGHNYVKNALEQGAVAALIAKKKIGMFPDSLRNRIISVTDPLKSLQRIAARFRTTLSCPIVGITGSSGKTTARSFVSAVLGQSLAVSETQGNWNNHIGVPLCLLRFTGKENVGVLEFGANHMHEIRTLSKIARPDIGIIMNIGYAHIGYFGSLANIAKAKFEIVDGMKKSGILLLNGDDQLLVSGAKKVRTRVEFFGTSKRCGVRAENVELTDDGRMRFAVDGEVYELPMPGGHFVYAALAAIAVGRKLGVSKSSIDAAFSAMRPAPLRGTIEQKHGATFVVDCYNANPSSMKSGIGLLSDVAGPQPKVAIVGDMLELGTYAPRLHTALGRQLAKSGVNRILAVGEHAQLVKKGAMAAGVPAANIATAETSVAALPLAKNMIKSGDAVLLKGSRGVHLETIYEGLDGGGENARQPQARKSYPKSWVPKLASIIGAAKSGIGAAKFLKRKGVDVFVSDTCSPQKLDKLLTASGLASVRHEAGGHTSAVLDADVIILSPGVRSNLAVLIEAKEKGIPVWSEVELAFRFTDAKFLAITGSSGKSTTTSMLGAIMAAAGKPHAVAGNIGIPLVNVIDTVPADGFVVAEISSFQLETIDLFRPHAGAVLNLMKNHLDRYESEEDYYNAKKEIARNLTFENHLVLNSRDSRLVEWATAMAGKTNIVYFGGPVEGADCVWHQDGVVWATMSGVTRAILETDAMFLRGPHNYDNACAAAALALAAGIGDEAIAKGICGFRGLPHRLEYIDEIKGVRFYNDSKATTAESVLCAVTAFGRNVHLIAGGRDKGCDFSIVKDAIRTNVRGVYLIGEAAGRISAEWHDCAPQETFESLEEAMRTAQENAKPGDVVVLSPGCSSFDMFENYEHRGEIFGMIVRKLKEEAR